MEFFAFWSTQITLKVRKYFSAYKSDVQITVASTITIMRKNYDNEIIFVLI